jgi:hypothetical protein
MTNPQSWNDFPVMEPMDPRLVISKVLLDDNTGASKGGTFSRVTDWLQNVTWVNPVLKISDVTTSTFPTIQSNSAQDYESFQEAIVWNSTHAMTATNPKLPLAVKKIVFAKAGKAFDNIIYLDFIGGATSTNVQISFRDNSITNGQPDATGAPTIPVFAFPTTATYGGTGRKLIFTVLRPGRFALGIRVVDNLGNYSMFELELHVEA